jgi:hypothetical protein
MYLRIISEKKRKEWRKSYSGRGGSNPRQKLGRLLCYRYTTPAIYRQTKKKRYFVNQNTLKRKKDSEKGQDLKNLIFTIFARSLSYNNGFE